MAKKATICPTCSLPIDLCVCKTISKEESKIKIKTDRRKWGRIVTLIEFQGDTSNINIVDITKKLKGKAACGGTFKENTIELQGDHRFMAKNWLKDLGFDENNVSVSRGQQDDRR
ncbi:MAG: stress response translation initiation inhibitor YciH [Candidatus Hodarchaeota archaeon]